MIIFEIPLIKHRAIAKHLTWGRQNLGIIFAFKKYIFTILPYSEPYQSLFCVQYIKGAYEAMIISKKHFKLVLTDCKGNVIQVSQERKM